MSKQHNPDEIRDYLVVEFPNEATDGDSVPLCVVPKVWVSLKHNICYWPKLKNEDERRRAVIKKTQFEPDLCTPCPMVVRYKTNSYEKAMEKLKLLERSEIFSSFSTHSEDEIKSKRKSKPNPLYKEFQTGKSRQYSSQPIFQTRKQNSPSSSEDDLPSLSPPRMRAKTIRIIQSESETEEQESTITEEKSQQPVVNSSCHSCKNSEVKLDSAIKKLELLSQDVKFLLQMVQRNAISEAIETPSDLVLPISGEEELQEFNKKLANDEDFFRNMTASLLCVGGKDIADATRRIMNKLISHDLSLEYNWTGRGKKNSRH